MADQPSEPSSGFWTLTRPSKLSKRRNSDLHELHHKVFNISVVGLSGTERDKGPIGIGKSCLCNRFVRSASDDYFTDHISVLSQSDFGGHVVNNDHWLYWGSVIKSCDGYDLAFNVIEQTEFIDDVCFQPFKSGKTEPYHKRCATTKLVSPEKLMYICKNQLGIEREYEQRYLPEGKFNVDGFLCLFDVSEVQGRDLDKQIEMTNLILLSLIKTKKPVVFVTTKHDEASDMVLAEAERLINQREFRGFVPIVETSAQENVNINMAFLVCAQMVDRSRAKLRVPPYFEAYRNHLELLKAASDAYLGLIQSTIHDHRNSWQQVCMKLSHNPEFLQYTYLNGLDKAASVFKDHIRRLHEDCINQKVQNYIALLPSILDEMIPRAKRSTQGNQHSDMQLERLNSSSSIDTWSEAKEYIRLHPQFEYYFIQIPKDISWFDTEVLQSNENRLPSDWLDSNEAYTVFQQRNARFETEKRRQFAKEAFAQMLVELKLPVGKPFVEVKAMFNSSDLNILSDQELFEIYVEYQNNLLQKARTDFQELLLENAEHLHNLTTNDKVIRQDDIKKINAILQHDERYQALDRFDQDRTLMMIRHLSFLHSQLSEQCPSHPHCVESEIERLLITKAKSLVSRFHESKPDKSNAVSQRTCDLVIFGPRRPSQQLILALNVLNSRAPKSSQYQITFTVFDNAEDVDSQIQKFRQSNTKPQGCLGIFTNSRSLEHVGFTAKKFLALSDSSQNNLDQFGGPPIVMLYAADITLDERTMLKLENEGQQMADGFKCPFMNVTAIDQYRQHQQNNIRNNNQDSSSQVMSECASLDYACVDAAFNVLKEAISRRVCFMELYNNQDLIPRQAFDPDARILMCLLCGEPFCNELLLWKMFLNSEDCYVTSSKSICFKMKTERGSDKYIGITIASYTHGAFNYKNDLLHGFILVCSLQRRASLSVLDAFSYNIPCTPVMVLAVNADSRQVSQLMLSSDEDDYERLLGEAKGAAARLKGQFELLDLTSNEIDDRDNEANRLEKFVRDVIRRKPAIDRAYGNNDYEIEQTFFSPTLNTQSDMVSSKNPRSIVQHQNNAVSTHVDNFSTIGANQDICSTQITARDEDEVSTDEDETTGDSCDKKFNSRPMPGKLDLRQFDNITSAIGKLSVTSSASPTPNTSSLNQPTKSNPSKEIPKISKQRSIIPNPHPQRINNLRQNHGRAVAPPKLPSNLQFREPTSKGLHTVTSHNLSNHGEEESAIDFSQSPIAQRLLKYSKDHKVSELNSPYTSDSEQPRDGLPGTSYNEGPKPFKNSPLEPSELRTTRGETIRQLNEILAKKPPAHVASAKPRLNKESSSDRLTDESKQSVKDEKDDKKDKKKLRSEEKLEKRKLKEEDRLRRQEEEKQRRLEKKLAAKKTKSSTANPDLVGEDGIPLFIKRCIEFIESQGLDAEGIYRVPGNRAHVDTFVLKFKDDPTMSIPESDIPVNAVATALKDFLSKKLGPIIPLDQMNELTELAHIPDKEKRVEAVRNLIRKLPTANYKLLRFVFAHFVKVSLNSSSNSMDSKNLAICWWPTLLPLHFDDMVMFEQMRPHLEESIQTMIDQFNFIFAEKELAPALS